MRKHKWGNTTQAPLSVIFNNMPTNTCSWRQIDEAMLRHELHYLYTGTPFYITRDDVTHF